MISLKHNFIFIHPPKTGGNTIHNILKKYYEPNIKTLIINNSCGASQGVDFEINKNPLDKHSGYKQAKKALKSLDIKEEIRLISTIRNPWERIVSYYCWFNKTKRPNINAMKRWFQSNKLPPCTRFWNNEDPYFVVRMEHYDADLPQLLYKLSIPIPDNLKQIHKNCSNWKKEEVTYRDFYKDNQENYDKEFIKLIGDFYKEDIDFSKKLFHKKYEF